MKNKKRTITAIAILYTASLFAQQNNFTLKNYIIDAIKNKSNIASLNMLSEIEALKTAQLNAGFLPQVSLAYDVIYNPIIRSSIVPVGKFNPTPTDEVRAIKFGTNFQQSLGVQAYQPIIDATIKSKIAESKIQQKIKLTDIKVATEELVYEVSKTYINGYVKQQEAKENARDTNRTLQNLLLVKAKFDEGKILKTEVNKAQINHNNAVEIYRNTFIALTQEKIYLAFLTNKKVEQILINDNDEALKEANLNWVKDINQTDSLANIEQLNNNIDFTKQLINSEKTKYKATIGLNGYLGVDQFTRNMNPLASSSWFGNSFVGVSVKLPILLSENKANKTSQYQLQIKNYSLQKNEIIREAETNKLIALNEIDNIKAAYDNAKANADLYKETLYILQERLKEGQITNYEVNIEAQAYQKEIEKLTTIKAALWLQWLNILKSNGLLKKLYN